MTETPETNELLSLTVEELEQHAAAHLETERADEQDRRTERAAQLRSLTRRITDGANARGERARLIRHLSANGWTQEQIAGEAEITQQAVSKILKSTPGERNIANLDAQSQWYMIGRVFGIGNVLAGELGEKASPGSDLYRLTEKYFAQPLNAELMKRVRRPIDKGLEILSRQAHYRTIVDTCSEALDAIDERLTVPAVIIRPGTNGADQFIFGYEHQRAALLRATGKL